MPRDNEWEQWFRVKPIDLVPVCPNADATFFNTDQLPFSKQPSTHSSFHSHWLRTIITGGQAVSQTREPEA